ncbi:hypothetical protein [Bradyrhizobium sp. SZCCHNR3015]|uniref:hypothetical protein n=1 Tax=Bradyrhizobium sp. SZCCHNR3015 TaxID=3057395 RepID=UPI00291669E7|nr:hypothetical protein [Bradyrhizobium sp. SZCCHNR3015]
MAITQGAGPHAAWITINGLTIPVEVGSVSLSAKRKTSSFNVKVPMSFEGAQETLANVGDNEAVITTMTRGQISTLLTGEADDAEFDYIARTIQITGRDRSAKLHAKKTNEKWLNRLPSEIVQDLIERVGMSGNIGASQLLAGKRLEKDFVRLSDNVSFAYIIHKMAQFDGARWWVDAQGQFHYQPMDAMQGEYSITVNQNKRPISSDCKVLKIRRNIQAGKKIAVTVKAWHPKRKEVFEHTSNVEGNGGPREYNYHIPTLEQDHVAKHARSMAAARARHELTVHAQVVGDPTPVPGMGLKVTGTDFDQAFPIVTVHHAFGMTGHSTSITARSAKSGRQAS